MAVNPYFNPAVRSEQSLYEDLVMEAIRMKGLDVYYIPRIMLNKDPILFDDIPSKFSKAYKIEMYLENVDGFSGEGHLFSKFGIEIRDQATFVVSKRRWSNLVQSNDNTIQNNMPREGDLIYLPLSKSMFQIMLVERESPFYQLSNLNVFKIECELFEYNDEHLDTGVEEIDVIQTLGYELKVTLDEDSNGPIGIIIGDTATQTLGSGVVVTGIVTDWYRPDNILSLAHITSSDGGQHSFTVGGTITFSDAGNTRIVRGIGEDLADFSYQNDVFDSDVNPYLVFDENNPFGSPE